MTLATYLRSLPQRAVDMRTYSAGDAGDGVQPCEHKCGTTACALGWSTVLWPEMFSIVKSDRGKVFRAGGNVGWVQCGYSGHEVQEWFGLAKVDCDYAFGPFGTRSNIREAEILEQMAREKGWVMG